MPRRLVAILLASLLGALLAAAPASARTHHFPSIVVPSSATYASERANFLRIAKAGISNARKRYWNPGLHWYNDRLNDGDQFPLATVWSIVGLFEAIDGVQIAQPSNANRRAVRNFANFAERYWDRDLRPHGGFAPYPGDRGANVKVWFDDNSWWAHAFIDAYRATGNRKYLDDAIRTSDFVDARGWSGHGMWWNTDLNGTKSDEAMSAATNNAAEIYELTGNGRFLKRARKYLKWANRHMFNGYIYGSLTYANGAIIGALVSICRAAHDPWACARARYLGEWAMRWWGRDLNKAPHKDAILLRNMMRLANQTNDPRFYAWAYHNAQRALRNAKDGGLFLKFWNGSKYGPNNSGVTRYGQIITHGATISLFAWLGAVKPPQG